MARRTRGGRGGDRRVELGGERGAQRAILVARHGPRHPARRRPRGAPTRAPCARRPSRARTAAAGPCRRSMPGSSQVVRDEPPLGVEIGVAGLERCSAAAPAARRDRPPRRGRRACGGRRPRGRRAPRATATRRPCAQLGDAARPSARGASGSQTIRPPRAGHERAAAPSRASQSHSDLGRGRIAPRATRAR